MKKTLRKLFASTLAAAMTAGCLPVLAASAPSADATPLAFHSYLDENFNDKTVSDADTLKSETMLDFNCDFTETIPTYISTQKGMGGRPESDQSVVFDTRNHPGGGGSINVTFENEANITDDIVTVEASMLVKGKDAAVSLQVPMNNTAAQMRTIASFEKDGSIKANEAATGLQWKENNWYKLAATINLKTAKWDIYINGRQVITQGALGGLSQVDFLKRFKAWIGMPSAAGSYNTYFAMDDCKLYSGAYDPAADQMTVAAGSSDYIVSETDKKIYISSEVGQEEFLNHLSLENAELAGIYSDATLTEKLPGDTVADGVTALFRTPAGTVYDAYTVVLKGEVLGIEQADYVFDNTSRTIYAPVKTPADVFYQGITLYEGHTGALVIGGTPLGDSDLIERGQDMKYRVSYNGKYVDYDLITEYKFDNFDGFLGRKLTNNQSFDGYTCYASTPNHYIEGVKEGGNRVLHTYLPKDTMADGSKTDGLSFRRLNMTKQDIGDKFVVTWDVKADSLGALDAMIFQFQNTSGSTSNYNNILQITESGEIQFGMQSAGTFQLGVWQRFTMAFDIGQKIGVLYLNGTKAKEMPLSFLGSFDHIVNLILSVSSSTAQDRNFWMDNFAVYQIYDLAALNEEEMRSEATSEQDIIGTDGILSGYGRATVSQLIDMLNLPDGACAEVYYRDGSPADSGVTAEKGMELIITAKDGRHTTAYPLGDPLRAQLEVSINGKPVSQLYSGTASAAATLYSVSPQPAVLVLEQYKNGALVQSKTSDAITVTGGGSLTVTLDTPVAEEPDVVLKASLYNNLTDKTLLIPVQEIAYSENLELSTEILKVKDGRDAIYTITMDDGYGDSTEKFYRPWFEQYNLVGTGLNMCVWMDTINPVHKRYVENALEMTENGILDIISHSYTHPGTPEAMDANLMQEVAGSQEFLRNLFPGQDVLSFGPGDGILTAKEKALLPKYYYGVRTGARGYNNLDLTDKDFQNIVVQGVLGKDGDAWKNPQAPNNGETAASMNKWLDTAVSQNKWLVEMWHSVCWLTEDGTAYTSDGGYRPIQDDIAEPHLAYASQLQAEGKLWVAKFDDVIRYIRERQGATLIDDAKKTSRVITLTHDLNKDQFNYPLTLKSEVPATWKYAKVTQGFGVQTPEVTEENGKYYVMYDAYPNEGQITLEQTDTQLAPDIKNLTIYTPERTQDYLETMEQPITLQVGVNKTNTGEDMPGLPPAEESQIRWYVNGQLQQQTGTTFDFTPAAVGTYRIYAQAGMVKSQFRTVKILSVEDLPMQRYMVNDNFEEDGNIGAAIPAGQWDYADNRPEMGIKIAADPKNPQNKTAHYWDDNEKTYFPFLNAPIDAGEPFVISGKAYLTLNRDMSHCISVHTRGGVGYLQSMTSLLCFSPGGVISTGGDWVNPGETILDGTWEANTWIRYELYVTPNSADPSNSTVKLVVSGVKDRSGNPAVLTLENNAMDLSKSTYASNQKIDVAFATALVKGAPDSAYADDIKIYVPEALKLRVTEKTEVALNAPVTVTLGHDVNSSVGITKDDVRVTAGEEQAAIASVDFDVMNPDSFTIRFEEGALQPNTEYTVSLSDRVTDIAGNKPASPASFITGTQIIEPPTDLIDAEIVKAFPGGKLKAVTAGFDDGFANYNKEKWLTDLFTANGIKATFHLPSGSLKEEDVEKYKELYKGFEVSTHTRDHDNFFAVSPQLFEEELKADLERLPDVASNPLEGIAYPNGGSANEELKALLAKNGIKYGRTTWCSKTFNLPDDLYNWNPTVFQNPSDANELPTYATKFAQLKPEEMALFYVWGHSYQIDDSNQAAIQTAYEALGNKGDTWYAANGEIADYLTAIEQLVWGTDESKAVTAYNPSARPVWVLANGTPVEIPAGGTKVILVSGTPAGESIQFHDPCSADPNGQEKQFFARENGVGQAKGVPDPIDASVIDDGYSRWAPAFTEDAVKGQVHSLVYQVSDEAYDITQFNLVTYRHDGYADVFRVFVSPDNVEYTEVSYQSQQSENKNSWALYRFDLSNSALPAGTKYMKICFPANFAISPKDSPNYAALMDVKLTFAQNTPTTVTVTDTSPALLPALIATTPEDQASGIPYDQSMTLLFNKTMDPGTVTPQTITVEGAAIKSITPAAGNKAFNITFEGLLKAGTIYTVSLSGEVTDGKGTSITPASFSFTTEGIQQRILQDTMCDTRYILQAHGDLMTTTGIGPDPERDVHLYRLSTDAKDPAYVVYRAPYGELESLEVLTYRNTGAVNAPFILYTSTDGETYTKLMDDTQGVPGTPDGKWYVPSTCSSSALPEGTKYLKIEFPAFTNGETASHMATIGNVSLTYRQTADDKNAALLHPDLRGLDTDRRIIEDAVSIDTLTTGKATLGVEIRNFKEERGGKDAKVLFAIYKNGVLERTYAEDIIIPSYGDAAFSRQEISLNDANHLKDYTIKCFIWDFAEGLRPLGNAMEVK